MGAAAVHCTTTTTTTTTVSDVVVEENVAAPYPAAAASKQTRELRSLNARVLLSLRSLSLFYDCLQRRRCCCGRQASKQAQSTLPLSAHHTLSHTHSL